MKTDLLDRESFWDCNGSNFHKPARYRLIPSVTLTGRDTTYLSEQYLSLTACWGCWEAIANMRCMSCRQCPISPTV